MIRRLLATVGMLCLVPIGRGLMMGSLTVFAAAQRAGLLITVIWLLERFVVPVIVAVAFPETVSFSRVALAPDPVPDE